MAGLLLYQFMLRMHIFPACEQLLYASVWLGEAKSVRWILLSARSSEKPEADFAQHRHQPVRVLPSLLAAVSPHDSECRVAMALSRVKGHSHSNLQSSTACFALHMEMHD